MEGAHERATHVCRAAEPNPMGNLPDGQLCRLQQDSGGLKSDLFDKVARGGRQFVNECTAESSRAHRRALSECIDRQISIQIANPSPR